MPREDDKPGGASGVISSVAGLARHAVALLLTRVELAAIELSEARAHVVQLLLVAAAAVITVCFALACFTAVVVVLAWNTMGWRILLVLGSIYALVAMGMLLYARSLFRNGKLALPATMAELRKDRNSLFSE